MSPNFLCLTQPLDGFLLSLEHKHEPIARQLVVATFIATKLIFYCEYLNEIRLSVLKGSESDVAWPLSCAYFY